MSSEKYISIQFTFISVEQRYAGWTTFYLRSLGLWLHNFFKIMRSKEKKKMFLKFGDLYLGFQFKINLRQLFDLLNSLLEDFKDFPQFDLQFEWQCLSDNKLIIGTSQQCELFRKLIFFHAPFSILGWREL